MSSLKAHCSLSYHSINLDVLDVFAVGIRDGIYNNNPPFTAPPGTQAAYQAIIDDYINKRAAYKQGGKAQKGPFQASKEALIAKLDAFADYVDGIAIGDVNIILLAGFVPTKTGDSQGHAPVQPVGVEITRGVSGELFAECAKVDDADSYGCIVFAGMPMPAMLAFNAVGQLVVTATKDPNPNPNPIPQPDPTGIVAIFDVTKARKKKFVGLQPHVVYYFYFFAVNAKGVSPLSEVRSLECL